MTDRFKFRVFNLRENKYLDIPTYITQDGKLVDKMLEEDWFDGGYIREIATGKKDKNGKLIYENDRVKFIWYGEEFDGTIIWYLSSWGIKINSRFIRLEENFSCDNPKNIEVIGNIHKMEDNNENM